MTTKQRRPPRFARGFNKAAAKMAGRRFLPLWALVQHRGRKSGKSYETPIAILGSTPQNVYIALPWGDRTDWVRNLQAADGGKLMWKGQAFSVAEPEVVDKSEALAAAPGIRRRLSERWMPESCLRLRLEAST